MLKQFKTQMIFLICVFFYIANYCINQYKYTKRMYKYAN